MYAIPWPLILPVLAVVLSFAWLYAFKQRNPGNYALLLAFSGAFLLAVTLFELLPEAYASGSPRTVGLFVGVGILLQIVLETFSQGAEHGHVHGHGRNGPFPWLLFGSLCLHALSEGLPLMHAKGFLWGIVVHKIPVTLIIGGFLLRKGWPRTHTWGFIGCFALMTPLGALLGAHPLVASAYAYLLPLVIGIVLHVSTIILFESSEGHAFNWRKLGVIILGMALGYLI
ncbi:ZIP family metal transporter [Robiginitalea sp. M366]|uniref:ZIP family metal transporter n=1 Tax=Robiginitalea aestuariiviva TaxID=3036903 RepID=UPI00240DD906|nr:ZIP family metal transporter [Robiginitalea aestuariiviva]MDG1573168.1 ZIP family metal transporter [Robiginitalea aestuariiviva]